MSGWQTGPGGILTPTGWPSNPPKEGPGVGFFPPPTRPDARIMTGVGPAPNPDHSGWSLAEFSDHIQGRANSTIRVLIGVAVLRKRRMIFPFQAVGHTGAVWQDWKGTTDNPRAHRFPCNPTIGTFNIPEIPASTRLRDALIEPLAITDYLPKEVNYTDERFEALGGIESAVAAVRFVLKEQPEEKPVSRDVIYHAAMGVAIAGYSRAYAAVRAELLHKVNTEQAAQMIERNKNYSARKPTTNLEAAQDLIEFLSYYTRGTQPRLLMAPAIAREAERLETLA